MSFIYWVEAVFTTADGLTVAKLTNASQSLFLRAGFRPKMGQMVTLLFDNDVPTIECGDFRGGFTRV